MSRCSTLDLLGKGESQRERPSAAENDGARRANHGMRTLGGMNKPGETEAAPGYGSARSPVVIVGQSLCEPCMESKEPFDGGSGIFLDRSLDIAGSTRSVTSGDTILM